MKVKKGDFVWFWDKYTLDPETKAGVVVDIDLWWCHIIPTGETEPIKIHRDGVASSHEEASCKPLGRPRDNLKKIEVENE